ncbi:MAG: protoporphyrinogen oxidase [Caldilineaceae bacterium]|nr:protoporphyrinogen oxidase [Caldilineaceae bacterium]
METIAHVSRFNPHVAIVGGGVSGLAAAWYLQKLAPELTVTLLEASDRVGGKIITHFVDSGEDQPFVLEAGADAFLIQQKPWAYDLALALGLADRLLPTDPDHSGVSVVNNAHLIPLPKGLNLILPTDWEAFERSPLLSAVGKARMAQERQIPARGDGAGSPADESVADFVLRRFGAEALEKLGEPLLSGIYSAHPEEQSILATFPRFREMEERHGSLLRAVEAGKTRGSEEGKKGGREEVRTAFASFTAGMEELPRALAAQVRAKMRLSTGVDSIERVGNGYLLRLSDGEALQADAVVLAIPAAAAEKLLRPLVPAAASALGQLRTVSSGVVYLAYARQQIRHPLQGYGAVIPRAERRDFNAFTWVTNKFAHRAPADRVLIRLFFGGARSPHMMERDDTEIALAAQQELRDLIGIDSAPTFHRVFRWWQAQPQYDVGHLDRMAAIDASLPAGLNLIGTAYRGVGIPDCVHQGKEAAEGVFAYLRSLF